MEKRTSKTTLEEIQARRELIGNYKKKIALFDMLVESTCAILLRHILEMMSGKRRRGRPRM